MKGTRFLDGFALGAWQANCYLLGDRELGTCVVIDPGDGGEQAVQERLRERGVRCEAILLTHGHIDHLWAAPALAEALDVEVHLHREDRWLWDDPFMGASQEGSGMARRLGLVWQPERARLQPFEDATTFAFAGLRLEARHTPGHTPGSSVFLLRDRPGDDPLLVSGDLLFAGSVGRTDLPRGSWDQQVASLERVVLPLPDATTVHPGHGPQTTVAVERATNPFLEGLGEGLG
jgi:hydroxyacylglutathione hydrolase